MNRILKCVIFIIVMASSVQNYAQNGFQFDDKSKNKVIIPFEVINNLIFIPMQINGVELKFLLDSGVEETVLFSLDEKNEVNFFNVKKIKLTGLGNAESIDGLKSSGNKLSFAGLTDYNHDLYIVLDQDFNFSSNIGVPVNGILGYHFFKNHLIEIDYDKRKIIVYSDKTNLKKKVFKRFKTFDISIDNNKPYVVASIAIKKGSDFPAKVLVDLGNSDAVWLFQHKSDAINIPEKNFEDFLGRGFSGDIHGKRARIDHFSLDNFIFRNPLVAFPDTMSIKKVKMVENRLGSIGGEILKRFTVMLDYRNGKMYLKKSSQYNSPFNYNMSGIEIHHNGMTWVQEKVDFKTVSGVTTYKAIGTEATDTNSFRYKFELKPVYSVANVRKDSPGDLSGLKKDDVIISINSKLGHKYTLQQINHILKSEEGKFVKIEVDRNGVIMNFSFRLKSML